MKKVIIIGCPGSGKSTLAIKLSQATGLPLCHLDLLNWNADRTTVGKVVFLERLNRVIQEDAWIIDGNYGSTMEMRLAACDTVIFLDYPVEICLEGIRVRRGKPRPDMPWIEPEGEEDPEFAAFVANYNRDSRLEVLELLKSYPQKDVILLKNRQEAEAFLMRLPAKQ